MTLKSFWKPWVDKKPAFPWEYQSFDFQHHLNPVRKVPETRNHTHCSQACQCAPATNFRAHRFSGWTKNRIQVLILFHLPQRGSQSVVPNQQQQHHRGTGRKAHSGPYLLNPKLWQWSPAICDLTSFLGGGLRCSWGTTAPPKGPKASETWS